MRLIDADDVFRFYVETFSRKTLGERAIQPNEIRFSMNDIRDNLDNLPTIDAVPVVRCKDCKYYNPEKNEYIWDSESCNHPLSDVSDPYEGYVLRVEPDDFCSRGERRTDETN